MLDRKNNKLWEEVVNEYYRELDFYLVGEV